MGLVTPKNPAKNKKAGKRVLHFCKRDFRLWNKAILKYGVTNMTKEQFKNAAKKMDEIQEMESFIEAFKAPYMNCIHASAFGTNNKDCKQFMIIHSDSELHSLILNHCNLKLELLKKEFQDL